jgi:2,3-dihydroxy-p-cumate/2,3-dihydroxybenzoate 3,4-dioxygenase
MIRYQRLGYVALNVSDLDRAAAWYTEVLGLQRVGEGRAQPLFLRCSDDHHNIVLHCAARPGLKRIGFEMESTAALEALRARLEREAIPVDPVSTEECEQLHLGAALRFVEPYTGATFECYESMRSFGSQPYVPTVAHIQRLGHVVLRTSRYREAVGFYTDVLNFRVSDTIDGLVCFMRCFPNPLHHSIALASAATGGLHHVNFMVTEVDDIGRALWRFAKAGVPVVNGPGRHPPSGSMFLYFLDPDGLTLEYSFGMEEFPEQAPRKPRTLEPVRESFDYWGAPVDPRKSAVGHIETPGQR